MIRRERPDLILIEDFFFSGKFANGANTNCEIRGIYKAIAALKKIPYVGMNQSEWKRLVAGRSTPTKNQVQRWGKQKAKKKFIVEALKIKHGIDCPSKSLNQKTNRPNDFKFDVSDAIGILIAYFLKQGVGYNTGPHIWDFTVVEEGNEGILKSRTRRNGKNLSKNQRKRTQGKLA